MQNRLFQFFSTVKDRISYSGMGVWPVEMIVVEFLNWKELAMEVSAQHHRPNSETE